MMLRPFGRKEVQEAVLIAALTAVATQTITWAFEAAKARIALKPAAPKADGDEGGAK